jgi:molybdenum-dependent DNA-binding transcriptional regulator ModE
VLELAVMKDTTHKLIAAFARLRSVVDQCCRIDAGLDRAKMRRSLSRTHRFMGKTYGREQYRRQVIDGVPNPFGF